MVFVRNGCDLASLLSKTGKFLVTVIGMFHTEYFTVTIGLD
jgi:hypothetical protein